MDEDSMMQLDDALSAVFKTRAQATKEKKKKKGDSHSFITFILI
jgi:DNA polymerase phi